MVGELRGKRRSSGRIAGRVNAGKGSWQLSCLVRESLGKLEGFLPLSSRSVTKALRPSHEPTEREIERREHISWDNVGSSMNGILAGVL
jgi:hypothetical protein